MLLHILWECGLILSTFVNIPISGLAYFRLRLKDKKYYNELKERSLKDKIIFNLKHILKIFIPIYNIIHPFKLFFSGIDGALYKWKKEDKNGFSKKIRKFIDNFKNSYHEIQEEFFPTKEVKKEKVNEVNPKVEKADKNVEATSKTSSVKKSDNKQNNSSRVNTSFYVKMYREEYNKLRLEYDELKRNGASKDQIVEVVMKMNAIVDKTNKLLHTESHEIVSTPVYGSELKLRR